MTRPAHPAPAAIAVTALLLLGAGGAGADGARPDLLPAPEPPLEGMEEPVRKQLASFRSKVTRDVADPETPAPELMAGFGRLGQLYLVYGLDEAAEVAFANARRLAPEDARWSYYLGVALERQGRLEEAAAAYGRVLDARPHDPAVLVRRGWIELHRGRPEAAVEWFSRLLERDPDSAAALFGLGQAAAERGDWNKAAGLLRRALEIQPDASSVHYPLGMALRQLGDLDGARRHLKLRGDRAPVFPDPLITGLDTLAVGPWSHLERGRELLERGDLDGAVEGYRAAVAAGPGSIHARKSLARALARQGKLEEAAAEYRAALGLDPDQPHVRRELGGLLVEAGRPSEGIRHLERAVELAPDFADAYTVLATALERTGRIDAAAEAAAEVARLRPEDSVARLELGRLRLLARLDPAADPATQLRSILDEEPDNGMARLVLGSVLASRGDAAGSLAAYREILERSGGDDGQPAGRAPIEARAHLLIARRLVARQGLDDEVVSHLSSAVRAAPDLPATHLALGQALAGRGEHAVAAESFRRALTLDAGNAEAHAGRITVLLEAGRCAAAAHSLERAAAAVPGDDARWGRLRRNLAAICPPSG